MALAKHNPIAHYIAGQAAEQLGNALVYPIMPFSPAGDPVGRPAIALSGNREHHSRGLHRRRAADGAERGRRRFKNTSF